MVHNGGKSRGDTTYTHALLLFDDISLTRLLLRVFRFLFSFLFWLHYHMEMAKTDLSVAGVLNLHIFIYGTVFFHSPQSDVIALFTHRRVK